MAAQADCTGMTNAYRLAGVCCLPIALLSGLASASSDPIAAWLFNESVGATVADDAADLSDGLVRGDVLFGEPGVDSQSTAAYFDGSGDYIEVPHNDALLLDKGTIVLWFNADDLSTRRELFSKDSRNLDTGGHITMHVDQNKRVRVRIQSTTGDDWLTSSSSILEEGEWHHVAFVFGPGGCELYVDGILEDTDSYEGGLGTTSGGIGNYEPLVIGGNTWQSGDLVATPVKNYFKGSIDDVAILGERLEESSILTLAGAVDSDKLFSRASSDSGFGVSAGSDGNGLLWSDLNGDGDLDAIITGSSAKLLWNDPVNGTFSDVSLGNMSRQAAIGDFDNDGDADFWNREEEFWENLGSGALTDRGSIGMSDPNNNEAVAAVDVNADGRLDIVMLSENGNWIGVNYDPGEDETTRVTFEPTNNSSDGLHVSNAYGNGDYMSTADVNNDGFLDLFYHVGDGRLFLSNGDGTFTWNNSGISVLTGNNDKTGSAWGDYDNDGDMDLWMSRYDSGQPGYLFRNNGVVGGSVSFTEVTSTAGLTDTGNQRGCAWGDFDNDGDLDLAIAREGQGLVVYDNQGDGSFLKSSAFPSSPGDTADVCFVDVDNDGDLDLAVSRKSDDATLLINSTDNDAFLLVEYRGGLLVNAMGIGVRLELWNADNTTFIARREIGVARGYGGQEPTRAHFGGVSAATQYTLRVYEPGDATPRSMKIRPGSVSTTFGGVTVAQLLTVEESNTPDNVRVVRWREVSPLGEDD